MASPKVNREAFRAAAQELKEPLVAYLSNPVGAGAATMVGLWYMGPQALDAGYELVGRLARAIGEGLGELVPSPVDEIQDAIDDAKDAFQNSADDALTFLAGGEKKRIPWTDMEKDFARWLQVTNPSLYLRYVSGGPIMRKLIIDDNINEFNIYFSERGNG